MKNINIAGYIVTTSKVIIMLESQADIVGFEFEVSGYSRNFFIPAYIVTTSIMLELQDNGVDDEFGVSGYS